MSLAGENLFFGKGFSPDPFPKNFYALIDLAGCFFNHGVAVYVINTKCCMESQPWLRMESSRRRIHAQGVMPYTLSRDSIPLTRIYIQSFGLDICPKLAHSARWICATLRFDSFCLVRGQR